MTRLDVRWLAAAWVGSGLLGCGNPGDLSAVEAERLRPVHRYDMVQALASNGQVIAAGTQDGAVLISHDAGQRWQRRALGSASILGLASCPDGTLVGIDFYHRVWAGDATGQSWKSQPLEKPRTPLAVACDAASTWWVAGTRSTIASSSDRGATWKLTDLGQDAQITALQFPGGGFGVAVGEFGLVVVTTDGGATWSPRPRIPDDFYPYSAAFTSERDGWVSGLAGQILVTHDGARTWKPQSNETRQPLFRLVAHQGAVYGAGGGGVVARFDGAEWHELAYSDPLPVPLGAAAIVPAASAIAIGGPAGVLRVIGIQPN